MSGGINFDTTTLGQGGGFGYPVYGGYGGGYCGSNILDIAALGLVFGDGFGHRGHHDGHGKCGCCAPATCEQVNDVDRDVIKCSNDVDRDVLEKAFDIDRDVLLTGRDIKEDICHSTHKLEKDIWDTDKDVLMGFCDTNRHIDKVETRIAKESAEIKCLIKQTSLEQDNKELCRRNEELHDKILKQQTVSEILAALGVTPVIANGAVTTG